MCEKMNDISIPNKPVGSKGSHNGVNHIGEIFGRLTISEFEGHNKNGRPLYLCKCECGNEKIVRWELLVRGETKSCGCLNLDGTSRVTLHKDENLIGQKFGRLTLLKRIKKKTDRIRVWYLCQCDCGVIKEVLWNGIQAGRTVSCGCYAKEINSKRVIKPFGESSFNSLFYTYKNNAKDRGLAFELNKEQFKEITSKNCHYCEKPPTSSHSKTKRNGNYIYNGIDRVDNGKGYIEGNIVPCCEQCNRMKLDYTLEEFKEQIIKLYLNFIKE